MSEYMKLELKAPGDNAVMQVEQVFFNPKSPTHKYPDFTFRGLSGGVKAMLYIPEGSCRRQFSRLAMEPEDAAGKLLRFSRDPNDENPERPYWGITLADGTPRKRLTGPDEPKAPPIPPEYAPDVEDRPTPRTRRDIAAAYEWAYGEAYRVQFARWRAIVDAPAADVGDLEDVMRPTAETVQAGAATLLIQMERTGLLFTPDTLADATEALDLVPVKEAGLPDPEGDFPPF